MSRRRSVPAAALTVLIAPGLLGGLLAGCAPGPEQAEPRSAAELVQDAQQRVRFWNTGHVSVHQVTRPVSRRITVLWESDYDINQRRWDATMAEAGGRVRFRWVGTADRLYRTSPDQRGAELGMWSAVEPVVAGGAQPHLNAVLSFEPGQVMEREADGDWSVAGTVPMPAALAAVGLNGSSPDEQGQIDEASGTAPAVLVISPDREVRELHLSGVTFQVTSELTDDARSRLKDAATAIGLSEVGEHVQVDQPPETAKILAPLPAASPTPAPTPDG
jgi:hypothetical protein